MIAVDATKGATGSSFSRWLLLPLLGLLPLLLLPTAWGWKPVWELDSRTLLVLALMALAYLAMLVMLHIGERVGRPAGWVQVGLVGAAAFLPVVLLTSVIHPGFSRFALIAMP